LILYHIIAGTATRVCDSLADYANAWNMAGLSAGEFASRVRGNEPQGFQVTQALQPVWTAVQPIRLQQSTMMSLQSMELVGFSP